MSILDELPPGTWSPPSADAAAKIASLEERLGRPLPPDLAAPHRCAQGISLADSRHRFLAPDAMRPIAELQAGDGTEDLAPRTWLAVVDLSDGKYVGVDLVPNPDGTHDWLECDHETLGEAAVIATSLDDFVRRALAHARGLFWLAPGHEPYRRLRYENPPSYWRRLHAKWYATLGPEAGSPCTSEGCPRLRVAHSVKCRRHHYEMVHRRPSPFTEE